MVGTLTEMSQLEYALYIIGLLTVISFLIPIFLRFSMAFSAQAIGKSLGFITSWDITRKNTFRMLGATLIGFLPIVAIVALVLWGGNHYLDIDLLVARSTFASTWRATPRSSWPARSRPRTSRPSHASSAPSSRTSGRATRRGRAWRRVVRSGSRSRA